MVNNSNNFNKTKNYISPQILYHKQTTTYANGNGNGNPGSGFERDRHKKVAELFRLVKSELSPLDKWISIGNSGILFYKPTHIRVFIKFGSGLST